jgi:predicted RNA-binding Zn ribbon-like protein
MPDATVHTDLLLSFVNSVDNEEQTDDLTTPAELSAWLEDHGLGAARPRASTTDLAFARRLRDALREAMKAHHDGTADSTVLDELAADLPVVLDLTGPAPGLRPATGGVRGALAGLMVAVAGTGADGTWDRLKICASDECQWAFFDASKNQSRTWCEWGCGNRAKTRSYRSRRRAAAGAGGEG